MPDLAPIGPRAVAAAEVGDRRQHEREPRRRRRRILDHGQLRVPRPEEILEGGRRPHPVLREPGPVVDEADVTVVDRHEVVASVQIVGAVDLYERGRGVCVEQLPGERARQEVVVHAEEDVTLGASRREERAIQRRPGVAVLQDPQLQAGLLLEGGLRRFGDGERVVRDEDDRAGRRRGQSDARGDDRDHQGRSDDDEPPHDLLLSSSAAWAPGRTASKTPRSSVM